MPETPLTMAQAILDWIDSQIASYHDSVSQYVPEIWLDRHIAATKLIELLRKEDE